MSETGTDPLEGESHQRRSRIVVGVVVCGLILAVIWWVLAHTGTPFSAGQAPSAATETAASAPATADSGATVTAAASAPAADAPPPSPSAEAPVETPAEPTSDTPSSAASADLAEEAHLATVEQPQGAPVPFGEVSTAVTGMTATVTELRAVTGVAQGIGEIAGPSLAFTVVLVNTGTTAVSTTGVVVSVDYDAAHTPAPQLTGADTTELPETIDAGGSVSASYVFNVPQEQRDAVRILVNVQASSPIAAFEGAAPTQADS